MRFTCRRCGETKPVWAGKGVCEDCLKDCVDIVDWFDPENMDHLKAYLHLQKTGTWPEGFIPDNIIRGSGWAVTLMAKMTDRWLKLKLK